MLERDRDNNGEVKGSRRVTTIWLYRPGSKSFLYFYRSLSAERNRPGHHLLVGMVGRGLLGRVARDSSETASTNIHRLAVTVNLKTRSNCFFDQGLSFSDWAARALFALPS